MKEKSLSVFISLNGAKGFFKEWHIPFSQLRMGLIGFALIGLMLVGFALDYVFSFSLPKYQQENQVLKQRLSVVLEDMEQLNARLNQIDDFSQKIKVIAGLERGEISPVAIGPLSSANFPSLNQKTAFSPLKTEGPALKKPTNPSLQPEQGDHIRVYMDRLFKKSKLVRQDITSLMGRMFEKKDILVSAPTIMPAKGWISSHFGWRQYPFTGEISLHEGMDIAGFPGSPVVAPGAGVVMFAGYKQGYGKVIVVDHGYELSTLYGHLSDIMVSKWQKVERGQVIGAIGNTGNSSGPHLHYEVRISNVPVDPANYILSVRH